MTQEEFSRFLQMLQDVCGIELNSSQSMIWYRAFKNIDIQVAELMIELFYAKSEKVRKPRPTDLMKYRSWAIKQLADDAQGYDAQETKEKCPCCLDSGIIVVKKYIKEFGRFYEFGNRCFCSKGSKMGKMINQIDKREIRANYKIMIKSPLVLKGYHVYTHSGERLERVAQDIFDEEEKVEEVANA